jgi:hypothetical protein
MGSRDRAIGTATDSGLDNRGVGDRVAAVQSVSLLHVVQTDPRAHPTSYQMGTEGAFPEGKAAGP